MTTKLDRTGKLAQAVRELQRRVASLEEPQAASSAPLPVASCADLGMVQQLRKRAGGPYEANEQKGAVVYGGAVTFGEREYLWERERPLPGLAAMSLEPVASLLSVLASPQRLALLVALLPGALSSQELQEALGVSSAGQLYHHLKEVVAAGLVEQTKRGSYQLAARHVVPLLTVMAAAVDLRE